MQIPSLLQHIAIAMSRTYSAARRPTRRTCGGSGSRALPRAAALDGAPAGARDALRGGRAADGRADRRRHGRHVGVPQPRRRSRRSAWCATSIWATGPASTSGRRPRRSEFLLCDACGTVLAVEPERLDDVRELLRARFGYEARFTHFPIAGRCGDWLPRGVRAPGRAGSAPGGAPMSAAPVPAAAALRRWTRIRASMTPAQWRRAGVLGRGDRSRCTSSASSCCSRSSRRRTSARRRGDLRRSASASPPTRSGMRHAFDADHIGAIDNVTRKLMNEGQRPAQRRLLLLARAFDGRLRARHAAGRRRSAVSSGAVQTTARPCTRATGLIGPTVSGLVPRADRDPEPDRPRRHHPGLPADAPRRATTSASSRSSSTRAAS